MQRIYYKSLCKRKCIKGNTDMYYSWESLSNYDTNLNAVNTKKLICSREHPLRREGSDSSGILVWETIPMDLLREKVVCGTDGCFYAFP